MHLTALILSGPVLNSNNRGENDGNLQTIQKIRTREGTRSVLSGYAIRRAIRDSMQATDSSNLWRWSTDASEEKPAGYTYGKDHATAMFEAIPEKATDYDDTLLFGYMVAAKGEGKERDSEEDEDDEGEETPKAKKGAPKEAKKEAKKAGAVEVSPAISTTPYDGDMGFVLGLKAKRDEKGHAGLNPFSHERHFTRYQYTLTVNLSNLKPRPKCFSRLISTLIGLKVGGSHGANASEVTPNILAWRFHKEPGRGGLYMGAGLSHLPDGTIDLQPLHDKIHNLGLTNVSIAGPGLGMTVAEALQAIIKEGQQYLV